MNQYSSDQKPAKRFTSTQWSLVLAAGKDVTPEAEQALASLCQKYWQPLYCYIRSKGYTSPEAQDLTQSFFAKLLEKNYLKQAKPERGKFRSFLLSSLKHYLANEWDRKQAAKRGGHLQIVGLEEIIVAEQSYMSDVVKDQLTPERLFERRWTLALLQQILGELEEKFDKAGKKKIFDRLKEFLIDGEGKTSYSLVAAELGMTEGAVKVAVHRLRSQFGQLLRTEIAQTVDEEGSGVDDEIRYLLSTLG
ncbi:MAG: sigma-70 family RNA polymerase sigma factor [Blastocatellia bacterium]|nr:sigma-70 family RNA polymerase sigma factor [Blastocatellia bacterium]